MILWLLLLLATTFPAVSIYPDEYIQPKWMFSIWVVCLFVGIYIVFPQKRPKLRSLPYAAMITSLYISISHPFENQNVESLHLCLLLPIIHTLCYKKNKVIITCCIFIELLSITSIVMSQCRAGYICLIVYVLILTHHNKRRYWWGILFFVMISSVVLLAFLKMESTKGRYFILKNSIELASKCPINGYGKYGFRKEYMLQQAKYFKENGDSIYTKWADDIMHPLNEFIYFYINWGIIGLAILSCIMFFPLLTKEKHKLSYMRSPLITVIIFSMLSYPLLYPLTWVIITVNWMLIVKGIFTQRIPMVLLLLSILPGFIYYNYYLSRWGKISYVSKHGHPKSMMKYYQTIYAKFNTNPDFLYDYAIESYYATDYKRSCILATECEKYIRSYSLSLLLGDIYTHLHLYDKAICHFQTANWMCPVRFAPLGGLMDSYHAIGDTLHADSIKNIILTKYVKVKSHDVMEIKKKALSNSH